MKYLHVIFLAFFALSNEILTANGGSFNYKDALTKSILFLEAQRSGKLPRNSRVKWRGDSGLDDGKLSGVDLVGGYYDAGDNVKYGLPMAFTVTTLAWAALNYKSELKATGELYNVQSAIRWGTDYFLKTANKKNQLWVQVGEPNADHNCWVRPEKMLTPRTLYKITEWQPGTEIAAETAAAMAAASMVFRPQNRTYARSLLNKGKMLFEFAKNHKGTYDGECPQYCSYSGPDDELLWAASWLYMATKKSEYYKYITEEAVTASVAEFSWDLKYAGAQVLLSEFHLKGEGGVQNYKQQADNFVCSIIPDTPFHQVFITPGGMVNLRDGANSQYVTGTAFLFFIYSNILKKHGETVMCGNQAIKPERLRQFAKQQMDYLLGSNPKGRSYMAGFGANPPTQPHHRGASVPPSESSLVVDCPTSFAKWFKNDGPNPNVLTGAIVGGPDKSDNFEDKRGSSSYTEPCTYINSLAVGPLVELAMHGA
ncbi:hypothetical protein LUZ60_000959 [Juncus effusus]|nr:hypothetical protein LUZ60_000959 [Juncus effusus]